MRIAPLYRTAPISHLAQPDFLNTVALAGLPPAGVSPRRLLGALKALEKEAGRGPAERDAPRVLDLDLLFFGDLVVLEERPTHGRRRGRVGKDRSPFPIQGCASASSCSPRCATSAPDLALPPDGRTVAGLYAAVAGSQRIESLGWRRRSV